MRVAVITSYFPSSGQLWQGRTAVQTLRLLARRLPLKVFYPLSKPPAFLTSSSRASARLDPAWRPRDRAGLPEIDVAYIPYPVLPLISRPLNGWLAARAVLPHVRAWKPEVLLNYVIYPDGDAALRVAQALSLPLVTTAIGSDLNRIPNALVGRHIARTLRGATRTTTVSADLARTAIRLGAPADRTRPILNGCDTSVFFPQDRTLARRALNLPERSITGASAQIALYVGRLDLAKGLIELIEATARLHATRPGLHLYLLGHGPDEPLLRNRIHALAAASYITLKSAVPMEQVAAWMAASDLVTLPSYREGCPNVIVEALAAGRPVVASNVGGIPELLDDSCGRMVAPRAIEPLTQALEETLSIEWDPAALHAAHRRSWDNVADDLQHTLEEAAQLTPVR